MFNLQQKLKLLTKNDFIRNVSILLSGTIFSQLITLLALPIITRLYTPQDFGVLAVYVSLVSTVSVIACMRYEIAIPIPKEDKDAITLLLISLFSVITFTIIITIAIFLFQEPINESTNYKIANYIYLIPLGIFGAGLYNALQFWTTRNKDFKIISKSRMTQSIMGTSCQLGLGYFGVTPLGLILGQILFISSGVIRLTRYSIKNHLGLASQIDIKQLKYIAKKYSKFPKYSTWEAFANTGAVQIPIILIAYYAVGVEAGFLMLAMRLLAAPMSLIGGSISQVYLAEAALKHHNGELKEFTHRTIITLIKIGFFPLLLAGLLSPIIIPLIFGDQWHRTGVLISWMAPWFFMQFLASPVSMSLHITNNQKIAMLLQLSGLILRVGFVYCAAQYFKSYIAESYAISGFIFYTTYIIVILYILRSEN